MTVTLPADGSIARDVLDVLTDARRATRREVASVLGITVPQTRAALAYLRTLGLARCDRGPVWWPTQDAADALRDEARRQRVLAEARKARRGAA